MADMFRSLATYSFAFLMLFMSVEGVLDPIQAEHGHEQEVTHLANNHSSAAGDTEANADHCAHCCHSHNVSMLTGRSSSDCILSDNPTGFYQPQFHSLTQAPPTPPPNA